MSSDLSLGFPRGLLVIRFAFQDGREAKQIFWIRRGKREVGRTDTNVEEPRSGPECVCNSHQQSAVPLHGLRTGAHLGVQVRCNITIFRRDKKSKDFAL